jgi:nuclease HARBI1
MEGLPTIYLYGDPSYKHSYGVIAPFKQPRGRFALEFWKQNANERMSSARIAVEHAFGHTQFLWTYTAFGKGLRAGSSLVAAYFAAAVLLTSCLTCLRGNQTSARFVVNPPSLEEYLLLN